jgi:hypothetical protein
VAQQCGIQLSELELDPGGELVKAQPPEQLIEVTFIDPERPADPFLETQFGEPRV